MALGRDLLLSDQYSAAEKLYIRIFGVPINGLRIRARRILPLVTAKFKNVMDAGCGPAVFTFEIARKLPNSAITGIDIDDKLIKVNRNIARKAVLKNCFFEKIDICEMNIIEKFDLIISIDNLEHIEDDDHALANFYNALSNNGEIIVHVPGYERRWLFCKWKVNFHVAGHCRPGYTKEQIVEKMKKAGFKVSHAYYTYGWLETITNNISYLITKAEMKNKLLYALIFPLLNVISFLGRNSMPEKGAGVIVIASK
jgi:2-polyprenyl-3-methyl-5-hydroxy-6-metoxy-1,4-benzoquinol methylase